MARNASMRQLRNYEAEFRRADTNNDGVLNFSEFSSYVLGAKGGTQPQPLQPEQQQQRVDSSAARALASRPTDVQVDRRVRRGNAVVVNAGNPIGQPICEGLVTPPFLETLWVMTAVWQLKRGCDVVALDSFESPLDRLPLSRQGVRTVCRITCRVRL